MAAWIAVLIGSLGSSLVTLAVNIANTKHEHRLRQKDRDWWRQQRRYEAYQTFVAQLSKRISVGKKRQRVEGSVGNEGKKARLSSAVEDSNAQLRAAAQLVDLLGTGELGEAAIELARVYATGDQEHGQAWNPVKGAADAPRQKFERLAKESFLS